MKLSAQVVGRTIGGITTHGKHIFIDLVPETGELPVLVLHTHMMMSGSWHVYRNSDVWNRPEVQAVVVIAVGDRIAVCFNAPVVELTSKADSDKLHLQKLLGPDILSLPLDHQEIRNRWTTQPPTDPISVSLLNQHVVAGIGNLYRSEALFLSHVNPFDQNAHFSEQNLKILVQNAADLMHANLGRNTVLRSFGEGHLTPWVYGRSRQPCRRCGNIIKTAFVGMPPRSVYWCSVCQPRSVR
jgi:endonuclease VIII